jgi:Tfp pilus assembly protein FimV
MQAAMVEQSRSLASQFQADRTGLADSYAAQFAQFRSEALNQRQSIEQRMQSLIATKDDEIARLQQRVIAAERKVEINAPQTIIPPVSSAQPTLGSFLNMPTPMPPPTMHLGSLFSAGSSAVGVVDPIRSNDEQRTHKHGAEC